MCYCLHYNECFEIHAFIMRHLSWEKLRTSRLNHFIFHIRTISLFYICLLPSQQSYTLQMLPQLYSGLNSERKVQLREMSLISSKFLIQIGFLYMYFYMEQWPIMSKERTIKKVTFWLFVKPPLLTTQKFKLPIHNSHLHYFLFTYITVSH